MKKLKLNSGFLIYYGKLGFSIYKRMNYFGGVLEVEETMKIGEISIY